MSKTPRYIIKKRKKAAKESTANSTRGFVSSINDFHGLKWNLRMPGSVYR
jgi:hypothetical protein